MSRQELPRNRPDDYFAKDYRSPDPGQAPKIFNRINLWVLSRSLEFQDLSRPVDTES